MQSNNDNNNNNGNAANPSTSSATNSSLILYNANPRAIFVAASSLLGISGLGYYLYRRTRRIPQQQQITEQQNQNGNEAKQEYIQSEDQPYDQQHSLQFSSVKNNAASYAPLS